MAVSKSKTTRNRRTVTKGRNQDEGILATNGLAHLKIFSSKEDENKFLRPGPDAEFEFWFEYNTSEVNEFLIARFTTQQLLDIAAEFGLLTRTVSTERRFRVPRGIEAAARVISGGAA